MLWVVTDRDLITGVQCFAGSYRCEKKTLPVAVSAGRVLQVGYVYVARREGE